MVADLEQVDKIDASEFHNVKLNAKEMISPKLEQFSKTADGQLKFIGGDQVLRTPTLTRYHPSSRRSSRRPSWRIRRVSTVQTSQHGETRRVTQPIKQCRRKRVSEQRLKVHDKYGETRYLVFL